MSSFDMDWSPDFCLACDRQTDGRVYCSEACRLAEYEKSSSSNGSAASSPTSLYGASWPNKRPAGNTFYMEPAYNFRNPQSQSATSSSWAGQFYQPVRPQSSPSMASDTTTQTKNILTPSSSQLSLYSIRSASSSSSAEATNLSDESRKALRAYASSFDQSRNSRRQST